MTLVFCKLRPSFSLSRQRSRVRAPSPRHTSPKTYGTYGPPIVTTKSGHNELLNPHVEPVFLNQLLTIAAFVPSLEIIIFTTLLSAAQLFEFTTCV